MGAVCCAGALAASVNIGVGHRKVGGEEMFGVGSVAKHQRLRPLLALVRNRNFIFDLEYLLLGWT